MKKMLRFIIVSVLIACAFCRPYHGMKNVTELIESEGYPVETYYVQTQDGYLLDLIRIPGGVGAGAGYGAGYEAGYGYGAGAGAGYGGYSNNKKNYNYQQQNQDSSETSKNSGDSSSSSSEENSDSRPAVLLMHNVLASSEDFVIGGPTQGLAYILANYGYDVYLGNARGSIYGRKHTVLNPDRDPAFWKFCWDDIGRKDLPAIIDKVKQISQQKKIYYIGHMQGSTVFYVMASEVPEYNDQVYSMISLGPLAFVGHSTNTMLKTISEKRRTQGWVIRNLGEHELKPSSELVNQGGSSECNKKQNNDEICHNFFFLLNGYNSKSFNSTTVASIAQRVPAGASTRSVIHYAQLVESGRFAKYRFENNNNNNKNGGPYEDYNLSQIRTPMAVFYTPHDSVSEMVDVDALMKKLPNVKQTIRIEEMTNNLDFVYGNNVNTVYDKVIKVMRNIADNNYNNNYQN